MKKNKLFTKLKAFFMLVILLPAVFVLAGCGNEKLSAYQIAVKNGYTGTETEWLSSLKGKSAYEIAVENGFYGTEAEWLESLKGKDAEKIDSYDLYLSAVEKSGFTGTYLDFLKNNLTISADTTAVVASKSAMSVVEVKAYANGLGGAATLSGSGVIYKLDSEGNAYIITNYHVTYNSTKENKANTFYKLYLYGVDTSKAVTATFVGGSATYDISVLKVEASEVLLESNAQPAILNTEPTKLGTSCLAIGSPSIGSPKKTGVAVSRGIVSRESDEILMNIAGKNRNYRLIRHDSFTSGGSSGGGLFNMNGELIGITNGGESNYENANYAIPASTVYSVAENIIKNCTTSDAYQAKTCNLGISVSATETSTTYNLQTGLIDVVDTVVIEKIDSTIIFDNALEFGDVLTKVIINENTANKREISINRYFQLEELLLLINTNDTIKFVLDRNGTEITTSITAISDLFNEIV